METIQAPSNDEIFDNETSLRVALFLREIMLDQEWRCEADCRFLPPERFVPADGQIWTMRETKFAKAICSKCVVIEECLDYALDYPELPGVWGGKTLKQRETIRRESKNEKAENVKN